MSLPWDNPPIFGDKQGLEDAMERIREAGSDDPNADEAGAPEASTPETTPPEAPPTEMQPSGEAPSGATTDEAAAAGEPGRLSTYAPTPTDFPALNYAPDARVTALIPAPGWEMLYLDDRGREAAARLVAWAMTDEGVVRGLIVASTGEVVFGDTVESFRGYNDRGDSADVVTALESLNTTMANLANRPAQGITPATSTERTGLPPAP